jgi:hypothetical protein
MDVPDDMIAEDSDPSDRHTEALGTVTDRTRVLINYP